MVSVSEVDGEVIRVVGEEIHIKDNDGKISPISIIKIYKV